MLMPSVARMMRWPACGGKCVLCGLDEEESVAHFLQRCPTLAPCRERFEREVEARLCLAGQPRTQLLALLHSGGRAQLRALLGEPDIEPLADDADQAETNQQACALWVDKLTKNFLQACWRLREALVGKLRVEHRVLIHEPGRGEVQAVMARLLGPASEHKTEVVAKGLWRAWLDKARRRSGRPSKRQRSAFFVVHRGREPGLFYKWSQHSVYT